MVFLLLQIIVISFREDNVNTTAGFCISVFLRFRYLHCLNYLCVLAIEISSLLEVEDSLFE
jgi:hypothetical protein